MKKIFIIIVCFALVAACAAQPRHGRPRHCATEEQMQMVINTLKKQSFDSGKREVADLCVVIGTFCVHDLARMAATFSFDDNRRQFLEFAYPYCVDPENYFLLREVFTFSSNYDKLVDAIHDKRRRPRH